MDYGLLKTLSVGDIKGDFHVPAYQRGYRWGQQEVERLLSDIRDSSGATYYLQPVVVKARDEGGWELVDGQQRLTTLYIIFQYLRRTHLPTAGPNYSITYDTRPGSKAYLDRLSEPDARLNIDFFHMFSAYRCIEHWFARFEHRATHEATVFYNYLFDRVAVLWYEAPQTVDSTELFTRLNIGRIALTDAELAKALLLSRSQSVPSLTGRAPEIAAHWDNIERDLRKQEVWAFVTGEATEEPTPITLLLDTLASGPRGPERKLFHTFETLREQIEKDPEEFWRDVVELHSLVLGWFDDRDLFHKVGYLIAVGRSFEELVSLSKGKGRSVFEATLDDAIRAHLDLSAHQLTDLTYSTAKTSDVLLLMNVETIRRMQHSFERYSFRSHAAGRWSLEHIHAQNAESLSTAEQWTAWLAFHKVALAGMADLDDEHRDARRALIGRIEEVLATGVTRQSFSPLEKEVTAIFSPRDHEDAGEIHSISNLALLDQRDNAALNNSVFEVKRRDIIRLDKQGSYIPAATRNVFLKYYTETGDQQLHFWSDTDRREYLSAILKAVEDYLRPEDLEA